MEKDIEEKRENKNEPIDGILEELGIPDDKRLISQVLDIMSKPRADCDTRRQSPWVSGSPVQDTCDLDLSGLYPEASKSVAQVLSRTDGTVLFGTAFKLCEEMDTNACYYVTNSHVVGSTETPGIVSENGKIVQESKVVARDRFKDLVLIEVPEADSRKPVQVGPEPSASEPVFTIGHPYGFPQQVVAAGKVTQKDAAVQKEFPPGSGELAVQEGLFVSSVSALQGNSGGPEFDKNGKLVGVKVMSLETGGSVSIKAAEVLDLIERYKEYNRANNNSSR